MLEQSDLVMVGCEGKGESVPFVDKRVEFARAIERSGLALVRSPNPPLGGRMRELIRLSLGFPGQLNMARLRGDACESNERGEVTIGKAIPAARIQMPARPD